jgi:uncharacterized membrane protein
MVTGAEFALIFIVTSIVSFFFRIEGIEIAVQATVNSTLVTGAYALLSAIVKTATSLSLDRTLPIFVLFILIAYALGERDITIRSVFLYALIFFGGWHMSLALASFC